MERLASSAPAPQKALARKRRCTTKTRSGCLTCKRRRIRCDEHKPQCWNCLKSKERVCEGYQPPKPCGVDAEPTTNGQSSSLGRTSPTGSATASSSSNASASSSSNTSASTTPTGAHAPDTFPTSSHTGRWSRNSYAYHIADEAPGYFPNQIPVDPTAQYRPASFSTPIICIPKSRLHDDALNPSIDLGDLGPVSRPRCFSHTPHLDYPTAKSSVDGDAALYQEHSRPLLHPVPRGSDLLYRRHSQPASHSEALSFATAPSLPSPFTITPTISPLIADPVTARSFAFYLRHSGSAMGARSSPFFFLNTIPQVANAFTHVRHALLAVALVDESVDDHATDDGRNGPGIECINYDARKASYEMYGRAVRALVEAKDEQANSAHSQREADDALAATLITCLLLFSFECWIWNLRNAGRHLEGAVGLMQNYEHRMLGMQRRCGLLEDKVLPMMRQACKYHDMSLNKGVPASKFGQGATWAPEEGAVAVA